MFLSGGSNGKYITIKKEEMETHFFFTYTFS